MATGTKAYTKEQLMESRRRGDKERRGVQQRAC